MHLFNMHYLFLLSIYVITDGRIVVWGSSFGPGATLNVVASSTKPTTNIKTASTTEPTSSNILSSTPTTSQTPAPTPKPTTKPTSMKQTPTTTPTSTASTLVTTTIPARCKHYTAPHNGQVSTSNGTAGDSIAMITCVDGFILKGCSTSMCLSNSTWNCTQSTCQRVDCGIPGIPTNGSVFTNAGTTFGSVANFICDTGYTINGNKSSKCRANKTWSDNVPTCQIIDCGNDEVNHIANGTVTLDGNVTTFKAWATYICNDGYQIAGISRRTCLEGGVWSGYAPQCKKKSEEKTFPPCPKSIDSRNNNWTTTPPGMGETKDCGDVFTNGNYEGIITRTCSSEGKWLLPKYDCIREELSNLKQEMEGVLEKPSEAGVTNVLESLTSITVTKDAAVGSGDTFSRITDGEIEAVTNLLHNIANVSSKINVTKTQSKAFFKTTSNLLDMSNKDSWQSIEHNSDNEKKTSSKGADKVLHVIDTYTEAIASSLTSKESKRVIANPNMVLVVAKINKDEDVQFPNTDTKSNLGPKSRLTLPKGEIKGAKSYSAVFYKNLTGILSSKSKGNNESGDEKEINSAVLSLKLASVKEKKLGKPLIIVLEHFKNNLNNPSCSFWNFTSNSWDTSGCRRKSSNSTITVCECDHFTNFAILMSPWTKDNVVSTAIDVVSIVGCSISLLGLVITVVMHVALWRYVKSDRVVILINLSVALVISYVIFIAGVDRTENKDICTAVAAMLQYIYLVVFFLMLAEGVPAVIVGISMGVTKLDGYGTDTFCWLSVEDGLIWSFIGPVILILMINIVLLILIMRAMFGARSLAQKSKKEKTKTGVRCLCILLPLMGCTWAIGIFYVNIDMVWIQYVFAVCNSLQGFVIFIFHCALNTQIRIAIQRKQRKYSSSFSRTQSTTKPVSLPRVSSASSSFDIHNSISSETDGNSRSSVYDSVTDNRLEMIERSRKNSTRDDSVRKNETRYHR